MKAIILGIFLGLLLIGTGFADNHPGIPLTSKSQDIGTNLVTPSFTVAPNQLALMWVVTGQGIPTVIDPSRTWVQVRTGSPGLRQMTLFSTISALETIGPVELSIPVSDFWNVSVVEFPATSVVQTAYGDWRQPSGARDHKVTLLSSGAGITASGYGLWQGNVTPGQGLSLVGSGTCDSISGICLRIQSSSVFVQIHRMLWPDKRHWLGIAVELQ